jgi:hypothetical protein
MQLSVPHSHQAPLPTFTWPASATAPYGAEFTVVLPGAGENHIGIVKMQMAAKRNLVLTVVSSLSQLGGTNQATTQEALYQYIVSTLSKGLHKTQLREAGDKLIVVAEHSLGTRHTQILEQIGRILTNAIFPREYRSIGKYYEALSINRRGDFTSSTLILEQLATSSITPLKYRARALKAIGGNLLDAGNPHEASRFFLEASLAASSKYGGDLLTVTLSQWMMAVIRSIDGDHKGALQNLEKLSSLIRLIAPDYPHYYYSYANALAVEFMESEYIEEARNASSIALASPFADRYPEFRATAGDISQKSRRASHSVVSFCRRIVELKDGLQKSTDQTEDSSSSATEDESHSHNLVVFPSSPGRPARTSSDPFDRKLTPSDLRWMTTAQKRSLVIEIAQAAGITDELLERMMSAAGVVISEEDEEGDHLANSRLSDNVAEPASEAERADQGWPESPLKEIDLETSNHLEAITSLILAGNLGPHGFAAVMSALRDCQDDARRRRLIDRMITQCFREARGQAGNEDEWRRQVEARLTPTAASDERPPP